MKRLLMNWPVTVWGCLMVSASGQPVRTELSGRQVFERSQAAYGSLKSYSGTTHLSSKQLSGGKVLDYDLTAVVMFVRPGKLRVDGTTIKGSHYAIICDGTTTWVTSNRKPGGWERAASLQAAIVMFTGLSRAADYTVPSILIGNIKDGPFAATGQLKVTKTMLDGKEAYQVETVNGYTQTSLWLDQNSYFLLKMHQHSELTRSAARNPAAGPSAQTKLVLDVTQTFSDVKINQPVPSAAFLKPLGAP